MDKVKLLYVRNEKKFPVGCVAFTRDKVDGCDRILYNFSIFNPKDKFDKKYARIWAAGKLALDPQVHIADGEFHINDLLHDVCVHIEDSNPKLPKRFVKALELTRERLVAAVQHEF
jgi:hypothetical protein